MFKSLNFTVHEISREAKSYSGKNTVFPNVTELVLPLNTMNYLY